MAKAVETAIGNAGHLLHFFPHMRYGFGADGSDAWLRNTSCSGGTGRSDRAEYIPFKYSLTDLGMEIFLFPAFVFGVSMRISPRDRDCTC